MQTASINKYATVEFRMVFTLLKFSTSKPDRSGSPPLFSLDKTLRDLLHKLGKALNSNLDAVEDALRGVLDNLYFPHRRIGNSHIRRQCMHFQCCST